MKKRILAILAATLALQPLAWGQVALRDAFANAPDNLFPLLTRNNRLDCIDLAEGHADMDVTNRAGDKTRIDSIAPNYLSLRLTPKSRIELLMMPAKDDTPQRICMIHTYKGPAEDSHVSLFDTNWNLLGVIKRPEVSTFIDKDMPHDISGILCDFSLMQASFSQDGTSLTWDLPLTELNKKQQDIARGFVHPVTCSIDATLSSEESVQSSQPSPVLNSNAANSQSEQEKQ